jgi:hypothetical protein
MQRGILAACHCAILRTAAMPKAASPDLALARRELGDEVVGGFGHHLGSREARAFLGLPDIKPMQERILREVQERMAANIRAMEPEAMLRTWLPATLKGFEQVQVFTSQMSRLSESDR